MTPSLFVKVCGVTRAGDARLAADLGARAVGIVFHPESPRRIDVSAAHRIVSALPVGVLAVGVFAADPRREGEIIETARGLRLDLVQLHGPEAAAMASRVGLARCVVAVADTEETRPAVASGSAYLLADRPRIRGVPQGACADRRVARRLALRHPRLLLAGGLDAGNVAGAVRDVRPFGVDVSSGVEAHGYPGVKDGEKLAAFFDALAETKEETHAGTR